MPGDGRSWETWLVAPIRQVARGSLLNCSCLLLDRLCCCPRGPCSYGRTRHSAIHGQLAHTAARVMTPCGPCSYGRTRHPASYGQLAHTAARVIRCATGLCRSQVARSPWRCTTATYATRATWRLLHCSVSSAGGSYMSVISILEGRERPADGPGARIRSKRIQASSGAERSGARICICARFMWGGLSQSKRRSV